MLKQIVDAVNRLTHPLHMRVRNMVARGIVKLVNDDGEMQLVQVSSLGATRDDLERFQSYGFTSVPKDGAEAVVVTVGGSGDHSVVIVVDDRRYRLKSLSGGEVAMYDANGSTIVLKANGDIEVTPHSGTAKVAGDLHVTGDVSVSGDVNCDKTVTGSTDCVGGGKHLKTHVHDGSTLTTTATVGSSVVPGVISGSTAAPT